jgi:anti-sigma regulatory factor (Ser/Thr protein kinase)
MTTDRTALRHNALVYESQDEYVAHTVPFLKEGIAAGEGAIVAHTKPGLAMMREALGTDAQRVTFVDVSSAYTRPARTLAAYHEVYVELLQETRTVRAVADVQFGPDPGESKVWTRYEAAFNRSFGHLPTWVICSYNANGTPDPIIEGVWQTHPEVIAKGSWSVSDQYEDPDRLLRRITPVPAPLSGLRTIPFGRDVADFREHLALALVEEDVSEAKTLDMLLAASEIATNALEHGGGVEAARVGRAEGRFVCEIVDRGGGFDDPAAGYVAPRTGAGAGLWVARQLTWELEFFQSSQGFTARIWL